MFLLVAPLFVSWFSYVKKKKQIEKKYRKVKIMMSEIFLYENGLENWFSPLESSTKMGMEELYKS